MTPVAEIFLERDIKNILVIDDSFDLPRTEDDYESIKDFWEAIEGNTNALANLSEIGCPVEKIEDINNNLLKKLWTENEKLTHAKEAFNSCIVSVWHRKQDSALAAFLAYLKNVGIECNKVGTLDEFDSTKYKIIFIDYYLGPFNDAGSELKISAINESIKKVIKVIDENKGNTCKPLIVLMSSVPGDVTEQVQAEFREKTGLLAGMFYFMPKTDMSDNIILSLKLEALASTLPLRSEIQSFIDAIYSSIGNVTKNFMKEIKELGIEDYAYIQRLSLEKDCHPLGDYMLWLYSSYFGYLLFEKNGSVRQEQKKLDSLSFFTLPPYQNIPSINVIKLLKSAMFQDVDALAKHPGTKASSKTINENAYPHLGDIFINDTHDKVFMVINAECDLADQRRKYDPERTILVIPGELQKLTETIDFQEEKELITKPFEHGNEQYLIRWDTKRAISRQYCDFSRWIDRDMGFRRTCRLKLPFSIEIQRAFATNLSRVGLPVVPPITMPVKVTVYYKDLENKKIIQLYESLKDAFLIAHKDGYNVGFNWNFIQSLKNRMDSTISALKEKVKQLPEGKQKNQISKYSEKLEKLTASPDALSELWKSLQLSKNGRKDLTSRIRIVKNEKIDECTPIETILINIETRGEI